MRWPLGMQRDTLKSLPSNTLFRQPYFCFHIFSLSLSHMWRLHNSRDKLESELSLIETFVRPSPIHFEFIRLTLRGP